MVGWHSGFHRTYKLDGSKMIVTGMPPTQAGIVQYLEAVDIDDFEDKTGLMLQLKSIVPIEGKISLSQRRFTIIQHTCPEPIHLTLKAGNFKLVHKFSPGQFVVIDKYAKRKYDFITRDIIGTSGELCIYEEAEPEVETEI